MKGLYRLPKLFRRKVNRLIDAFDGGARQRKLAVQEAQQRQVWRVNARTQSQLNAAALQSDPRVISLLEEMVAARIGRPVRHVRSEALLRSGDGIRAHAHRRAYTKHWFEVSGPVDVKLMPLFDTDRLLVVFLKSASKLELCAPLEYSLSEQRGNGFRVPYFFGSFEVSDMKFGAWEAINIRRVPFTKYSLEDQTRVVEAIAAANAVRADGTVPVLTRWVNVGPRWFESKYRCMDETALVQWKELYTKTVDVLRHQDSLVRRLPSGNEKFLTHNDLRVGGNISVPPVGDVILFDWELSTLSVPGADLGVLSRVDSGSHLLSCYVTEMARYGFELETDAVQFALDIVEGFRSVHTGWQNHSTGEVERGLTLLTRHLG